MTVTYNKTLNAYQIIYYSKVAEAQGKRPYVRKQVSAGKTRPDKDTKKARIMELEAWALSQEQKLAEEAELIAQGAAQGINAPIIATDYLAQIEGQAITNSKEKPTRKFAERIVEEFIAFLTECYSDIYLHQINKKVALEFAAWLDKKGKSYAYKKHRWLRLGYVFNMINIEFEDSNLKYKNPFYSLKIDKVAEEEAINHRKTLSPDMMRAILAEAKVWNRGKKKQARYARMQRWAILFLLATTGIRPRDIYTMKWEQINLDRRTLTITHKKTEKKGIYTVLWLTPHLMQVFIMMQKLHKVYTAIDSKYVFSIAEDTDRGRGNAPTIEDYLYTKCHLDMTKFFKHIRAKYSLNDAVEVGGKKQYAYCVYSMRHTVGTLLTNANYNANSIDYLQGHAPNNTTARFYLNLEADPRRATEAMLDYMAYEVLQEPLGKVGAKYAAIDNDTDKKADAKQKEIDSVRDYDKSGLHHATDTVVDKAKAEADSMAKIKADFIKQYGEEVYKAMFHDNSPQ